MKLFGGASHSFREPEAHDRVALTPRRYNPFPEPDPSTSLGAAARERPPRPDGAPLLQWLCGVPCAGADGQDRKSTRLNSSHGYISYAVFCLKKKKHKQTNAGQERLV